MAMKRIMLGWESEPSIDTWSAQNEGGKFVLLHGPWSLCFVNLAAAYAKNW